MIPVDQTRFGEKAGNCLAACLASILELPLDAVAEIPLDDSWEEAVNSWLEQFGYYYCVVKGVKLPKNCYAIVGGPSPRLKNCHHAVIYYGDKMVHDPHPSRAGLKGGKRFRQYDLIIPRNPALNMQAAHLGAA